MNDLNDAGKVSANDVFQTEASSGAGAAASAAAGVGSGGGARVGFCQHCGKPLTGETIRRVGPAVYCEPCLAARLSGQAGGQASGQAVGAGVPPYGSPEWFANRINNPGPNPGLAALLGLIPGVGAMYNEQYAKGVVHLVVFAILASMADHVNGIFGIFVAGWVVYMAIEAHHTARARRDGTPLPNPFGLNDIGERMGFGRAWPQGPSVAEVAQDAAAAAAARAAASYPPPAWPGQAPPSPAGSQPGGSQPGGQQPAGHWGAPADASAEQMARDMKAQAYRDIHAQVYRDMGYGQGAPSGWQAMPGAADAAGVPPAGAPYGSWPYGVGQYGAGHYGIPPIPPVAAYAPLDPVLMAQRSRRFPAGAAWLIGLGCVFLLATTGIFANVSPEALVGFVVLGFGVWLFVSRMVDSGNAMLHDGSSGYPLRVLRAMRVSIWLDLIGTLFVLDGFGILSWKHSWPLLVILAGVMPLVERAMVQPGAGGYMPISPMGQKPGAPMPGVPMPGVPMPGVPMHGTQMPGGPAGSGSAPASNESHEGGQ